MILSFKFCLNNRKIFEPEIMKLQVKSTQLQVKSLQFRASNWVKYWNKTKKNFSPTARLIQILYYWVQVCTVKKFLFRILLVVLLWKCRSSISQNFGFFGLPIHLWQDNTKQYDNDNTTKQNNMTMTIQQNDKP